MLYITPVSNSDRDRLKTKAQLFKSLGPNPGHHLMVVYTQDVEATDVAAFKKEVDALFDSVESHQVNVKRGWPLGSNQLFRECAKLAVQRGLPWFFGELDGDPQVRKWLDKLEDELKSSGKRFMGAVVPTRGFMPQRDGTVLPMTDGEHMVGFGIYPADYALRSVRMPTIDVMMMWSATQKLTPFDIELRHETTPHAHRTVLIQHNLRTVNYRVNEEGQIICDNHPDNPATADHAKPVDPRAVIVHGCKDDSLANLVMAGVKSKAIEKVVVPVVEVPPLDADQVASEPPAPVSAEAVVDAITQTPETPPTEKPSYRAYQIAQLLKDRSGWRVNQIAKELKWPEDDVRSVIAEETSGLQVAKLGWVKPKVVSA